MGQHGKHNYFYFNNTVRDTLMMMQDISSALSKVNAKKINALNISIIYTFIELF